MLGRSLSDAFIVASGLSLVRVDTEWDADESWWALAMSMTLPTGRGDRRSATGQ